MSLKTNPIDAINDSLWQSRFDNSAKVANDAIKILKKAEKEGYKRGIAISSSQKMILR